MRKKEIEMIWNNNMGISYVDYKLAALQTAGWHIKQGTQIESVGFITYVATKGSHRIVMSFTENDDLLKLTGSINQKMGVATYSMPYTTDATERFIKYFRAIYPR
jgi:hypothetical protein